MKKIPVFILALAAILVLASCGVIRFDGSRTGSGSQLVMEYSVFNGEDSQDLSLEAGDMLRVDVVSEEGSVSVAIQRDGDEPVYQGRDLSTGTFEVVVPVDGTYKVTVTGENARGSVSVAKTET